MQLTEEKIKELIHESLKNRNQLNGRTTQVLDAIYKEIIPLYSYSEYMTSNKMHQLRKLLFIEYLVQVSDELKYQINIDELMFASVCTELALVEDEFNPKFSVPNVGIKSANLLRNKFRYILVDLFGYKPWEDENSFVPSIAAWPYDNFGKPKMYHKLPIYASYLNDINNLSDMYSVGIEGMIYQLTHDYLLLDGFDDSDENADLFQRYGEKALIHLNVKYGKTGKYVIQSPVIGNNTEIVKLYYKFKLDLAKIKES